MLTATLSGPWLKPVFLLWCPFQIVTCVNPIEEHRFAIGILRIFDCSNVDISSCAYRALAHIDFRFCTYLVSQATSPKVSAPLLAKQELLITFLPSKPFPALWCTKSNTANLYHFHTWRFPIPTQRSNGVNYLHKS